MKERLESFKGKRVLVLGLGLSGRSAAHFLMKRGASVVGTDHNKQVEEDPEIARLCSRGMIFACEDRFINLKEFDFAVVSPGISPSSGLYKKVLEAGVEVVGEVELACRGITKRCAAVTGTNGKTTVTLLTAHALESAGIKAKAVGNCGIPLTSVLDDPAANETEVFVIELSSFQLETLKTVFIDAGVILNITPDHLDRYPSLDDYAAAKIKMGKNIKPDGKFFIEGKCLSECNRFFSEVRCLSYGYSQKDYLFTDLQDVWCQGRKLFSLPAAVKGKKSHDLENLMASYALCSAFSISPEHFLTSLGTFKKPSHRIEFIRTVNGVGYYDDSKGTNIDAVIRAVESMPGATVLIAGGVDKGFPYTSWLEPFKAKVKAVFAVGQSKEKIKADLQGAIPVALCTHFEEAVVRASGIAKAGENVLLSPGCSSYDMFKDYAHRGREFQRIVNAFKENKE